MTAPTFSSGPKPLSAPLEVFGGLATQEDLDAMTRVFSAAADRPDLIPPPFLGYLIDFLQTSNIQITQSQIIGQTLVLTPATAVTAADSVTSTSYVDAGHAGPELPSLQSGFYLFLLAAVAKSSSTSATAFAALSVNGSSPSDLDSIQTANTNLASCFAVSQQTLTQQNNVVNVQYRVTSGTGTFQNRQLVAIRYANL